HLGSREQIVGYDVTYRYQGQQQTVRMDERPGPRLPVVDGEVVVRTAAVASSAPRGCSARAADIRGAGRPAPFPFRRRGRRRRITMAHFAALVP
ncbi:hypothetical protein ABTL46_21050, partial [Acinetobacter baumannii]